MSFRGVLFFTLAFFIVATRALGGSKSFGNVSGIRITDPNSIIEDYSVDKEDCEVCNSTCFYPPDFFYNQLVVLRNSATCKRSAGVSK